MASFNINELTSLQQDDDTKTINTVQSMSKTNFVIDQLRNETPNANLNMSLDQPYLNFDDGYGIHRDIVHEEDKIGKVNNFKGDDNQLFPRPYLTIPYTGSGKHHVDNESILYNSEVTRNGKASNNISGIYIEHQFDPLIPSVKSNIQNPKNIIPEDTLPTWNRGGIDTAQIRRDIDFFDRCLDTDETRKILVEKKPFMFNSQEVLTDN